MLPKRSAQGRRHWEDHLRMRPFRQFPARVREDKSALDGYPHAVCICREDRESPFDIGFFGAQQQDACRFVVVSSDRIIDFPVGVGWSEARRESTDSAAAAPVPRQIDPCSQRSSEGADFPWTGTSEFVDRLVRVADEDQRQTRIPELPEDRQIQVGAVLRLVDDQLVEPPAQHRGHRGAMAPQGVEGQDSDLVAGDISLFAEVVAGLDRSLFRVADETLEFEGLEHRIVAGSPLQSRLAVSTGRVSVELEVAQPYPILAAALDRDRGVDAIPRVNAVPVPVLRDERSDEVAPDERVDRADKVRKRQQIRVSGCAAPLMDLVARDVGERYERPA